MIKKVFIFGVLLIGIVLRFASKNNTVNNTNIETNKETGNSDLNFASNQELSNAFNTILQHESAYPQEIVREPSSKNSTNMLKENERSNIENSLIENCSTINSNDINRKQTCLTNIQYADIPQRDKLSYYKSEIENIECEENQTFSSCLSYLNLLIETYSSYSSEKDLDIRGILSRQRSKYNNPKYFDNLFSKYLGSN